MLILGSRILVRDNCGALAVRLYNLGDKMTMKQTYLKHGAVARGSVIKHEPHKKVNRSDKVAVMITGVRKKSSRKNGCYISFGKNKGVIISDVEKRKPVATRTRNLVCVREIKRDKKNANLYKLMTGCL
jgi:ribosomal protein L14